VCIHLDHGVSTPELVQGEHAIYKRPREALTLHAYVQSASREGQRVTRARSTAAARQTPAAPHLVSRRYRSQSNSACFQHDSFRAQDWIYAYLATRASIHESLHPGKAA
jgi:hypothetical protein